MKAGETLGAMLLTWNNLAYYQATDGGRASGYRGRPFAAHCEATIAAWARGDDVAGSGRFRGGGVTCARKSAETAAIAENAEAGRNPSCLCSPNPPNFATINRVQPPRFRNRRVAREFRLTVRRRTAATGTNQKVGIDAQEDRARGRCRACLAACTQHDQRVGTGAGLGAGAGAITGALITGKTRGRRPRRCGGCRRRRHHRSRHRPSGLLLRPDPHGRDCRRAVPAGLLRPHRASQIAPSELSGGVSFDFKALGFWPEAQEAASRASSAARPERTPRRALPAPARRRAVAADRG